MSVYLKPRKYLLLSANARFSMLNVNGVYLHSFTIYARDSLWRQATLYMTDSVCNRWYKTCKKIYRRKVRHIHGEKLVKWAYK